MKIPVLLNTVLLNTVLLNTVLLNIFGISYRSAGIFLRNHEEYLNMIDLKEIPSFQTLS